MTPRSPTEILTEAADLLEDEARAIFESNTGLDKGSTMKPARIVWDVCSDSLRTRHGRLLAVAGELRVMAKGGA